MAAHTLLNAFKTNTPAFGTWLTIGGFVHARSVARALVGLPQKQSWIMLDCEHGLLPLHPSGATEVIAAIHGVRDGPSALVRIPATGHGTGSGSEGVNWQIKYALDSGARGVLVPMVSTPSQAQEVVISSRFPPQGRRGFGSSYTQENWDIQTAGEYLNVANKSVIVLVQIETREGVQNVKAIAEVDGIDGLFIGPYDLSNALGYPPPSPDPHPEVEKVIQDILRVAHEAGKKCAMYCISGAQAARRAAEGFDMINVTSDVGAMQSGLAAEYKAAASV
ncbi:Pyruvate/Phosphoenolpyruvate kinase-like domain-containing protein [Lentinula raphanica]|uniref:Pyruvate/Phosphoenolpyruvate kinase-like domain-containing protein n=1 Tax=Lentinula raphanica TaxID=153919 RepID=A0AA38PM36_9AGAR|nr:Pyruvate/Phosphoenolpyruvate kinase-like domain-containing protein [Lentinula raphanica]KAJ3845404.1 Pyruvate/Phosphoenolpyruvate kinase-like domain-containing protein [Lentinula raphanica]